MPLKALDSADTTKPTKISATERKGFRSIKNMIHENLWVSFLFNMVLQRYLPFYFTRLKLILYKYPAFKAFSARHKERYQ